MFEGLFPKQVQHSYRKGSAKTNNLDANILRTIVEQVDEAVCEQNIKQLQNSLGLQELDRNQQPFKDLMHYLRELLAYPNTSLAELHRSANRLGNYDVDQSNQLGQKVSIINKNNLIRQLQNCPCCGFIRQQSELKILSNSINDVSIMGISTFMFFRTMRNLTFFLLIALIVFGAFAFASNIKASNIWNDLSNKNQRFQNTIKISLGSKVYLAISDQDYYIDLLLWQVWLGLALVVIYIVAYFFMQHFQVKDTIKIQFMSKSVSDYSLLLRGIPTDVTKQQIQMQINRIVSQRKGLSQPHNQTSQFQVVKINIGTPMDIQYQIQASKKELLLALEKRHVEYERQIVSWIMQLCQGVQFRTSLGQRRRVEQEYLENRRLKYEKYIEIVEKVKLMYMQKKQETLTDVFVTLQSTKSKNQLLSLLSTTALDKFFKYLTLNIYHKTTKMIFGPGRSYRVKIEQAPEPQDVFFSSDQGMKTQDLVFRKFVTFFSTFLLLGMSFAAVYGLSTVQVANQQNQYISFLISLCISIFNFIIIFVLRILTSYEYNLTQTEYQSSLAIKAIVAQLINTIAIPILVNRFLKKQNYIYSTSGLAEDIFLLSLTISFIPPLTKVFDVNYFLIRYARTWYHDRPEKKFFLNQINLNRLYQLSEFQSGIQYIYIISLFLFTCFFMPLQPVIIVFAIAGYVLSYWAQKYSLFHRCKRPVPGTMILYDTMVQFIYAGCLFYSLGSLTFINFIPDDLFQDKINSALVANLIAIGLSTLSLFIPYSYFYSLVSNTQVAKEQLFSKNRIFLPSQYDRINPATSQEGLQQYLNFVNEKKNQFQKQYENNQEQLQSILKTLQKQGRFNHTNDFTYFNPLHYLSPLSTGLDQLLQPKIEVIPPKVIQDYLLSGIIADAIKSLTMKNGKQGASQEEGNNWKSNQLHLKLQKPDRLQPIKHVMLQSGSQLLKHPRNNPFIYQQAQLSNVPQTSEQFMNDKIHNGHQGNKYPQNPFQTLNQFFGANSRNMKDPLKNPLNYGTSPYNPRAMELFKANASNMRKRNIIQAGVGQNQRKVTVIMNTAKRNIQYPNRV